MTAVAIAMHKSGETTSQDVTLQTEGGELKIAFDVSDSGNYNNVWLIGPATQVFKGEIS